MYTYGLFLDVVSLWILTCRVEVVKPGRSTPVTDSGGLNALVNFNSGVIRCTAVGDVRDLRSQCEHP